jgi:VanZ family protein
MALYTANALHHGPPLWMLRRDKLVHGIFFGTVAALVMRALRGGHGWTAWWAALGAFLLTVVYGGWDEYQQGSNPARSQDIHDWYADVIGSSAVFMIAALATVRARVRGAMRNL